jgi:hypothetical protein
MSGTDNPGEQSAPPADGELLETLRESAARMRAAMGAIEEAMSSMTGTGGMAGHAATVVGKHTHPASRSVEEIIRMAAGSNRPQYEPDEQREAAEIYDRIDRELAVEEARTDRLLRLYNL